MKCKYDFLRLNKFITHDNTVKPVNNEISWGIYFFHHYYTRYLLFPGSGIDMILDKTRSDFFEAEEVKKLHFFNIFVTFVF